MTELTYSKVNRDILRTIEAPGKLYWLVFAGVLAVLAFGIYCWMHQIYTGMGVSGLMHPVMWGVYITNFVFWVGIAHSGTLISAILFLFRARWRTSVYRSSEAMTVFAVMTAGLFPLIHLGRAWFFYWLLPYPNQRGLWVNFRSPLLWDVFAIGTYFTVSAIFFYVGLIPDLAAVRDKAKGVRKVIYSIVSLNWRGSNRQWHHYSAAYLFFAALATPLVVSVHSVVSWDFAMSIVPGWHSTIFAPYFVAGAIFSGLAMVLTLLIPMRKIFKLEEYITIWHLEMLAKLVIVTSSIITYSYFVEFFIAWYSGSTFERSSFWWRAFGDYWPHFWIMVFCNCIAPVALWWKKIRTRVPWLFVISILVNVGMWLERFVIIVGSLAHEYEPAAFGNYSPSWVEYGITAGAFAWFFMYFLLFAKFLPSVSIVEIKESLRPPLRHAGGNK